LKVEEVKCKKKNITTEEAALGRGKPVRSSNGGNVRRASHKLPGPGEQQDSIPAPPPNKRTEGNKNKLSLLESSDNSQRTGGSQ